jgi:hypothetical protein
MTRILGVLFSLIAAGSIAVGARGDLLVDNFDDGSDCGWQQMGDSHFMAGYDKRPVAPGHASPFALRVQKNDLQGWCGVAAPDLSRLDLTGATAIRFFARNAGGCGRLLVDFQQKGGTRWWRKVDLPRDGGWVDRATRRRRTSRNGGRCGCRWTTRSGPGRRSTWTRSSS